MSAADGMPNPLRDALATLLDGNSVHAARVVEWFRRARTVGPVKAAQAMAQSGPRPRRTALELVSALHAEARRDPKETELLTSAAAELMELAADLYAAEARIERLEDEKRKAIDELAGLGGQYGMTGPLNGSLREGIRLVRAALASSVRQPVAHG